MSKKALTLVALLLVAAVGGAVTPAAAAPATETFDGATLDRAGFLDVNTTESVNHFGQASWIVHVDEDSQSSLQSWADLDEDRRIVEQYNDSNRALVSAPPGAIGLSEWDRWMGDGLASRSYVESIRINTVLGNVDPVRLQNESAVPSPTDEIWAASWRADGEFSPRGIAFDANAEKTSLEESREMTGSTDVDADTSGLTAAVIDTGVNHANGKVFGNGSTGSDVRIHNDSKDFITGERVSTDGLDAVADPNGHGTHVAATIAADYNGTEYDGYAPNASILALRALDKDGSGSMSNIAKAIRYAADHDSDVIHLSLGSPKYNQEIVDAVEYATDQGSVVVVAAGNSRQSARWIATPADAHDDGVVAVAASNHSANASNASIGYFSQLGDDPGTTDLSEGASAGETVDVSGVGMKLTAMTPDTSGRVTATTKTGTSMGAPTVTGGILQAMAANSSLQGEPALVAEQVRKTARPLPKATTQETGAGLLAVDRLANGNASGPTQEEAMTETAEERDDFWTWLSEGSGGWIWGA